jgi:hypothetical protein
VAAVAGATAAGLAIALGTATLMHSPPTEPAAGVMAQHITVSAPLAAVPLSGQEILGLLGQRPDYGALSDPQRRASCLSGLGYPASAPVLGARPVDIDGRPAVLLVLPGDTPGDLIALVVQPTCNSANTGLIADTQIGRP